MAFWATTWEKTASTVDAQKQPTRLQDAFVRQETKIGNEDTASTLSHYIAMLQTSNEEQIASLRTSFASSEAATSGYLVGQILKIVTGTLPDLVRQDVVLARFSPKRNLKTERSFFRASGLSSIRESGSIPAAHSYTMIRVSSFI